MQGVSATPCGALTDPTPQGKHGSSLHALQVRPASAQQRAGLSRQALAVQPA